MKKLLYSLMGMLALTSCAPTLTNETSTGSIQVVDQVIMSRRSIRSYTQQPIDRNTLDSILRCGINAPNGKGIQAYELRVVDDRQMLRDITAAVQADNADVALRPGSDNIFFGAPVVVFVASYHGYDMSLVDCGLLAENIMLAAWARGIGSCCMAHPARLMKLSPTCAPLVQRLGFSPEHELQFAIALGYPNEQPNARPRKTDRIQYVK